MNRKRASLLLLVLTVLETSCAAREKGTVVAVTRSRESVRNCAFAGRVTAADTEERDFLSEGAMRQRTAELGGNVLLILRRGVGEAYHCKQRTILTGSGPPPTPIGVRPAPAPSPSPSFWPSGAGS